jgi:esterase/lipase
MKTEDAQFQVAGQTLRAKLFEAQEPKELAVLFIHGWTGMPNEAAARKLAENGFSSLTFSLRGHNNSDGKLENVTRDGSLDDAIAAYEFFKTKLPAANKIAVVGSSYGSYLAALLSSNRQVYALSLRVPENYPDENADKPQVPQAPDFGNTSLNEWRKQMANYDSTKSLKAVHDFAGPIQIIEAEKDDIVPHQTVQNYVNAVKDKSKLDYHLMTGWPHSLGDDDQRNRQYQEILLSWLNKQI